MRPAGPCRLALLAALQAGAVGTFETLARHAGVPEPQAKYTLANLSRECIAKVQRHSGHSVFPQRAKAIYSYNDAALNLPLERPLDALRFASQVWR